MKLNHIGRARVNVNVRWPELVKIYGKIPIKLLNIINANKTMKRNVVPLWVFWGPRIVLNSLCRVVVTKFHMVVAREGRSQKVVGIRARPRKDLSQLIDRDIIEEAGSNVENRLVIIFRLGLVI